jgi:alkylated DNA repair protein alkB family protein 8
VIINQYTPGQGINPHVDKTHCFDGVVGSVGLGSSCIMQFRHAEAPFECIDVWFPRRTAVVLTGDSRYAWTHGIAPNTEDYWHGAMYRRKTRVSVTWRRVIGPYAKHSATAATDATPSVPPPAAASGGAEPDASDY